MMKKRFWMFFAIMLLSIAMAFPAMAFAQNGSESSYTVTYTDPSGSFTDQVYQVEAGDPVPAFQGTPSREGWVFTGWNNQYKANEPIEETVTRDRTFSARWIKAPDALDKAEAIDRGAVRITDEFRQNGRFDLRSVDLIDGTFEVTETVWDSENNCYTATAVITDPDAYAAYYTQKINSDYGLEETYTFNAQDTPVENLTIHFKNKLSYTDRPDGTWTTRFGGWLLDADYHPGASGATLYVNRNFQVIFHDGEEGSIFQQTALPVPETGVGVGAIPEYSPAREGYVLDGWSTAADGTGTYYEGGESYDFSASGVTELNLYALWKTDSNQNGLADEEETKYTVTYTDGVDGEELFADQTTTGLLSGVATPAFRGTPQREGYRFAGWTPAVAGTVTEDARYTAVWEKIPASEEPGDVPQTGGHTPTAAWFAALVVSGCAAAGLTVLAKRRRNG